MVVSNLFFGETALLTSSIIDAWWDLQGSGLLALCRRTLFSECHHRHAIAWPDKLGTGPMAYGGISKQMNERRPSSRKSGGIPWVRFNLSMENEQTRARQNNRTRLAKPNFQARKVTGNIHFLCSADLEQEWWQTFPVDASTLLHVKFGFYVLLLLLSPVSYRRGPEAVLSAKLTHHRRVDNQHYGILLHTW